MDRSTKKHGQTGTHRPLSTTPEQDAMLDELAERLKRMPQDRVNAMFEYLNQADNEDEEQDFPTLDVPDIVSLKELITWWRSQKAAPQLHGSPEYRPDFPGSRANTGIRIHSQMLKDACAKAKAEIPSLTSQGRISPLIEYLLWQFLGFDPKYLQEVNEDV